jgi:hypothetical protein
MSPSEECPKVIVRAFGSEPIAMNGVLTERGVVEVLSPDGQACIGFAVDSVFRWDPDLFQRLRDAYEQGDRRQLYKVWRHARRFALKANETES